MVTRGGHRRRRAAGDSQTDAPAESVGGGVRRRASPGGSADLCRRMPPMPPPGLSATSLRRSSPPAPSRGSHRRRPPPASALGPGLRPPTRPRWRRAPRHHWALAGPPVAAVKARKHSAKAVRCSRSLFTGWRSTAHVRPLLFSCVPGVSARRRAHSVVLVAQRKLPSRCAPPRVTICVESYSQLSPPPPPFSAHSLAHAAPQLRPR